MGLDAGHEVHRCATTKPCAVPQSSGIDDGPCMPTRAAHESRSQSRSTVAKRAAPCRPRARTAGARVAAAQQRQAALESATCRQRFAVGGGDRQQQAVGLHAHAAGFVDRGRAAFELPRHPDQHRDRAKRQRKRRGDQEEFGPQGPMPQGSHPELPVASADLDMHHGGDFPGRIRTAASCWPAGRATKLRMSIAVRSTSG